MAIMKWQIGQVAVTKIVELEITGGSRFILPQATYEAVLPMSWLQPDFADERGRLKMSIHALVVETPHCRRYLSRQRQGEPADTDLEQAPDELSRGPRRRRLSARDDRHGGLHASPRRSRRLEHDAGRWPLGPDLSERPLPDRPDRIQTLDEPTRPRGHDRDPR